MFDVELNDGSSVSNKLLFNVISLLQEQNMLLEKAFNIPSNNIQKEENKPKMAIKEDNNVNIDTMDRKEMLAFIRNMEVKPKGKYMAMNTELLRKTIKEVI